MSCRKNYHHNASTLCSLEKGDVVEFVRGLYSHYAVFLGDETCAHLSGDEDDGIDGAFGSVHLFTISGVRFEKAKVCLDNFWDIVQESKAYKKNRDDKWSPLHPDKIVANALSKLGEVGYNVITQNCEHFANWCRYGEEKSSQVDDVLTGLAVAGAMVLAAGVVGAFAAFAGKNESKKEERQRQKY